MNIKITYILFICLFAAGTIACTDGRVDGNVNQQVDVGAGAGGDGAGDGDSDGEGVVTMPQTPVITAPASVIAWKSGYEASTPPQSGCSYHWDIEGGTLVSGQGTASITFSAWDTASLTLTCTVTNHAGSVSGTKTIPILVPADVVVPDWVPAIGEIADISLNTISDVRGTDTKYHVGQQIDAWAGAAYAENYGDVGSLIFHTGGHATGTDSNSIYSYDIAAQMWKQERSRATEYTNSENYIGDVVTGWMWAASGGIGLQVGEPFAAHTYAWLTWLPPDVFGDDGSPFGYLYTPGRASMSYPGQIGTNQPHKYAIGSSAPWTFAGEPVQQRPSHSFAFWDKQRRRVILGYGDATESKLRWVDPVTSEYGSLSIPLAGSSYKPYYYIGFHASRDDLYITTRLMREGDPNYQGLEFHVIDPVTSARYIPPTIGTPPSGTTSEAGIEWVEKYRTLVIYAAGDTVWTLTAPDDPRTQAWTWTSQTINGVARKMVNPPYTKFRYCPQYDLFIWPLTYDTPVQGFRIAWPSL